MKIELGDFRDWLRTHPADKEYTYSRIKDCLVAQYFTARGVDFEAVGAWTWTDAEGKFHKLPRVLNAVALGEPRTFSGALTRLETMIGTFA